MKLGLVARSSDIRGDSNFTVGCQFSPDGLCVLTSTASDNLLRLYNTCTPLADKDASKNQETRTKTELDNDEDIDDTKKIENTDEDKISSMANVNEKTNVNWTTILSAKCGDSIRSYAWYPLMNSYDPSSCAFAACARDSPIHLIDAYTSAIRATYSPYNALDEMESPTTLTFTPDGGRIVAGGFRTDRMIHIFDISRPGRDSDTLKLGKTRRSKDGQKGMVSSIAFPNPLSWGGTHVFAAGTYSPGSIYIYDDRQPSGHPAGTVLHGGIPVVGHGKSFMRKKRRFVDMNLDAGTEGGVKGGKNNDDESYEDLFSAAKVGWYQSRARTGITQLTWSGGDSGTNDIENDGHHTNANPYLLYSASRRSDAVLAWDMRMLSGKDDAAYHPVRGIAAYSRDSDTNQRLQFDLDDMGRRLFVASQDRTLKVYDTQTGTLIKCMEGFHDAVNGVTYSCRNGRELLAVATGARRFKEERGEEVEEEDHDVNIGKDANSSTHVNTKMICDRRDPNVNFDFDEEGKDDPPGSLLLFEISHN